jgi:hypothetical protein
MEFTTHFELHSQTTRLFEGGTRGVGRRLDGALTLYGASFQKTLASTSTEPSSTDYNSAGWPISNLSSCRFTRRY